MRSAIAPFALAALTACAGGMGREESDSSALPPDTTAMVDTVGRPAPDTSVATPPIVPEPAPDAGEADSTVMPAEPSGRTDPSGGANAPDAKAPAPDTARQAPANQDTAAQATTQDAPGGAATATFSPEEYRGWRQYSVHCARCHGQDALPNPVAPDLRQSVGAGGPYADPGAFAQIVRHGRGGMPGFEDQLTAEQIEQTHAYLRGRAENRLPPGRPKPPAG